MGRTRTYNDEQRIERRRKASHDYYHYAEWRNANLDHDKYINLCSWLRGCRHDMLTNNEK